MFLVLVLGKLANLNHSLERVASIKYIMDRALPLARSYENAA